MVKHIVGIMLIALVAWSAGEVQETASVVDVLAPVIAPVHCTDDTPLRQTLTVKQMQTPTDVTGMYPAWEIQSMVDGSISVLTGEVVNATAGTVALTFSPAAGTYRYTVFLYRQDTHEKMMMAARGMLVVGE